jgi:hypothetical protein
MNGRRHHVQIPNHATTRLVPFMVGSVPFVTRPRSNKETAQPPSLDNDRQR